MSETDHGSDVVRRRIAVRGRVQGVGFRYFTQSVARNLALTGFVRNEPDGGVVAEVQGPVAAVDEFLRHVGLGPAFARVDEVVVESINVRNEDVEFAVQRR